MTTGAGPVLSLDTFDAGVVDALRRLAALPGDVPVWLVGGAVRDALLGRAVTEVDVAIAGSAGALGRALADATPGAGFVVLDEERDACRVVSDVDVDLARLRAAALADDLRGRDFTVNALAVDLRRLVREGGAAIADVTGGLADLAARRVRPCAPSALAADPARVLRAVRLAVRLGWALDAALQGALREAAPMVSAVSAERVRAELVAILAEPSAGRGLRLLDDVGALPILLPESMPMRETPQSEPHRFDVWEHSLRAVEAADRIVAELDALEPWGADLAAHLGEPLGDDVTRREALKLAALLHDVAKPETRSVDRGRVRFFGHDVRGAERAAAVAHRWRLSRRAGAVVERLVAQHLRPMHLGNAGGITRRARYRFFRDLGEDARDLVLLALADASAVRGDLPMAVWSGPGGSILRELMRGAGEEERAAATPPLLRGGDVMAALGLAPGREVGRLLERVREAQALGLVGTAEEALELLRREQTARPLDTSGGGS